MTSNGNPCELTEEQREEISTKIKEEFGEEAGRFFDFPCDDMGGEHDGGGHGGGGIDIDPERIHQVIEEIIRDVAGEDFNGNLCDLY